MFYNSHINSTPYSLVRNVRFEPGSVFFFDELVL